MPPTLAWGLSIDSDVKVDRGDIVREVLLNTSHGSINFSVLGGTG